MLPFQFTEAAEQHVETLDEIILTFRVWGVNPKGEICVEMFDSDKRSNEPFNNLECTVHQEGKVTAIMPTHNESYIHDVVVDWMEVDSADDYFEDRTFMHGGFECLALQKPSDGLLLTEGEVVSIFNKQLWIDYHSITFAMGSQAAGRYMRALNKEFYTPSDLHEIIDAGYEGMSEHMGF
jgi:hypothetical protein